MRNWLTRNSGESAYDSLFLTRYSSIRTETSTARGDGDQGAEDAFDRGTEQQRDEDSQCGQVDTVPHDAGSEPGIFDLNINEKKDGHAEHAAPRVDGCHQERKHEGNSRAQNRNDIEQTGEHAQAISVADMEREIEMVLATPRMSMRLA